MLDEGRMECKILDALTPLILEMVEGCIVEVGLGTTTRILAKYAAI